MLPHVDPHHFVKVFQWSGFNTSFENYTSIVDLSIAGNMHHYKLMLYGNDKENPCLFTMQPTTTTASHSFITSPWSSNCKTSFSAMRLADFKMGISHKKKYFWKYLQIFPLSPKEATCKLLQLMLSKLVSSHYHIICRS